MDLRKLCMHLEEPPSGMRLKFLVKRVTPWTITNTELWASEVARTQGFDDFWNTVPRSPSLRAVENLEISQINVEAAYLQGSLTPGGE